MVFSSLLFLFLYFSVVLAVYYIVPRRFRNLFLFFANLVFYGWGEPKYIVLMLFSIAMNYGSAMLIDKYRANEKIKKLVLIICIILNIGMLGFFKYAAFIANTLNTLIPVIHIPVIELALPIGISFYTFQTMSYTIDVYRNDTAVQKNIITFGTYVALFPQLIAGPIVRYQDVAYQMDHRRENLDEFTKGVKIFTIGLAKKVLIANQMGALWDSMRATGEENGIIGTWFGIIAYSLQIYFDFSGYSDMACGLGNMFGFEFLKNFNYPYISKTITEFWRRWHISLGTWFREYVYIPLGGNRCSVPKHIFNLLVVWFLTGLWHGAATNFILWGLYFGVILIIEKFFLLKLLNKAPKFVGHIYSVFLIIIGWVIFYFEDMGEMGRFFADMFTLNGGIVGDKALTLILSYLPLVLIGIVASTPLAAKIYDIFKIRQWIWIPESILTGVAMLLCTASLVSQSYNPFLYFRF